ncbi:MAG: hypothetical protein ILNGONEN_00280 [Syntrophorhabdaceae bacterium]|nr:hypothetical protein [Syntrophorhabdaceae bacterium]
MRIYVAGPLTSPDGGVRRQNCLNAINAGIQVMQKGHEPFVPHLMDWLDKWAQRAGIEFTWQDYMNWCLAWLAQCEALLFLAPSRGANMELEFAKKNGLKVFYSVDEIL